MEKTRQDAFDLLTEYTKNQNLVKHMLAVEAAMRAYARRFDADEEKWAIVGLLHDFDYERFPEEHPEPGAQILREQGWSDEVIHAVLSHAAEKTGVERENRMEHALYASDDLTGLIVAVALVRPSKDIRDVKVKSVKKKWKDSHFAAGARRETAEEGAEALEIDLWEHVGVVLDAMKGIAGDLGLDGRLQES